MLKILVVCGNGLGSSFLMGMNIKAVLSQIGAIADVEHCDLSSAKGYNADIIVSTRDIAYQLKGKAKVLIELNNILDMENMRAKLIEALDRLSE
jgi:ascorbate PTS system EIIB component